MICDDEITQVRANVIMRVFLRKLIFDEKTGAPQFSYIVIKGPHPSKKLISL